jgi:hypothetical protein
MFYWFPEVVKSQIYTLLDETMATPDISDFAQANGEIYILFQLGWDTGDPEESVNGIPPPPDWEEVTEIKIAFHHKGTFIVTAPGIRFELWTMDWDDQPNTYKIAEKTINVDTTNTWKSEQIRFTGLTLEPDDTRMLSLRCYYLTSGAGEEEPEIYEEPT